MGSRDKMVKGLVFVMCLMVANSGFAANGDRRMGPVIAVKRTTTLNLAKLLQSCVVVPEVTGVMSHFTCQVIDKASAPTDVYPSTAKSVAEKSFNSPPMFTGGIVILAGGGRGVVAEGSFGSAVGLEDMKKALTELFEEKKLEGKLIEFYVHVVADKVG
jgi:hypothetical protein